MSEATQAAVNAAYAAKAKIVADQKAEIEAMKTGKHNQQLKAANRMIAPALAASVKATWRTPRRRRKP